jgi:hypothetical protein
VQYFVQNQLSKFINRTGSASRGVVSAGVEDAAAGFEL